MILLYYVYVWMIHIIIWICATKIIFYAHERCDYEYCVTLSPVSYYTRAIKLDDIGGSNEHYNYQKATCKIETLVGFYVDLNFEFWLEFINHNILQVLLHNNENNYLSIMDKCTCVQISIVNVNNWYFEW